MTDLHSLIVGRLLFAGVKLLFALLTKQLDVLFKSQDDSFVTHHGLSVFGYDFVQLFRRYAVGERAGFPVR